MDLVHLGGLRSENTSHLEHYDIFFFLLQWQISGYPEHYDLSFFLLQ